MPHRLHPAPVHDVVRPSPLRNYIPPPWTSQPPQHFFWVYTLPGYVDSPFRICCPLCLATPRILLLHSELHSSAAHPPGDPVTAAYSLCFRQHMHRPRRLPPSGQQLEATTDALWPETHAARTRLFSYAPHPPITCYIPPVLDVYTQLCLSTHSVFLPPVFVGPLWLYRGSSILDSPANAHTADVASSQPSCLPTHSHPLAPGFRSTSPPVSVIVSLHVLLITVIGFQVSSIDGRSSSGVRLRNSLAFVFVFIYFLLPLLFPFSFLYASELIWVVYPWAFHRLLRLAASPLLCSHLLSRDVLWFV